MVWTPPNPGRLLKNLAALVSIQAELAEEARASNDPALADRAAEAQTLVERLGEHPTVKACPDPAP